MMMRGRTYARRPPWQTSAWQSVLGGVADQATRQADLVHDRVAGIDTGTATDAFVLMPLRMSMPVGQTATHRPQSTQSPSPAALASTPFLRAPRGSPRSGRR